MPYYKISIKYWQQLFTYVSWLSYLTVPIVLVGKYTASLVLAYKIATYFGKSIEEVFDFSEAGGVYVDDFKKQMKIRQFLLSGGLSGTCSVVLLSRSYEESRSVETVVYLRTDERKLLIMQKSGSDGMNFVMYGLAIGITVAGNFNETFFSHFLVLAYLSRWFEVF